MELNKQEKMNIIRQINNIINMTEETLSLWICWCNYTIDELLSYLYSENNDEANKKIVEELNEYINMQTDQINEYWLSSNIVKAIYNTYIKLINNWAVNDRSLNDKARVVEYLNIRINELQ